MNTERSNSTLGSSPTRPAAAVPTPLNDDAPLPSDVLTLQAMIRELLDALKKEQREREGVQQRLDLLLRKLYGPKAERFDPQQPWLLPEMASTHATSAAADSPLEETPASDDAASSNGKHGKRKGGRKKLPESL